MSRTIVLKPQASKRVGHLLKNILSIEIEEQKSQSYLEKVLRRLYKNYQQKTQSLYYEILSCIEKWHIDWFMKSFEWRQKNFIINICHISFPNLKTLTLADLEIKSIEAVSWMDCPCLETINMSNNCVRSLKPLARTQSKALLNIYFQNNPISQDQIDFWQNRTLLNEQKVISVEVGKNFNLSSNGLFAKVNTKKIENVNLELELMSDKTKKMFTNKFGSRTQA